MLVHKVNELCRGPRLPQLGIKFAIPRDGVPHFGGVILKVSQLCLALLCLLASCSKNNAPGGGTGQNPGSETKSCTYISGPNFSNHRACYEVKDGADGPKPVYQGDIKLDRSVLAAEAKRAMKDSGRFATSLSNSYRDYYWPGNTIPYTVEGNASFKDSVKDSLDDLHARSGVTFVPRTNQSDYVAYIGVDTEDYCGLSYVGLAGGKQEIEISIASTLDCVNRSVIEHESLHALGFWHEQSRPDRDDFIRVLFANVLPGYEDQFDLLPTEADGVGNYDFASVMHYTRKAFSKNGLDTIQADTEAHNSLIGESTQASDQDIQAVQSIYGTGIKIELEEQTDGTFDAVVTYKTPEGVGSKIRLGTKRDHLEEYEVDETGIEHEIDLSGFEGGVRYFYQVLMQTTGGNAWTQTRSFITDVTPPRIIDARVHRVSNNAAEVRFSTDERTQGLVAYYKDEENSEIEWAYDFSFGKVHNLQFSVGQGNYIIFPVAVDEAGNQTIPDDGLNITNDTVAPTLSNIQLSNLTIHGATLSWRTNESGTSKVWYGTSSTTLNLSTTGSSGTDHTVELTDLANNTTYFYKLESRDAAGNAGYSGVRTFSTDLTGPTFSGIGALNVRHYQADIVWQTNEASDSKVSYGNSCSNLNSTISDAASVTSHTIHLTGLSAATAYCYKVISKDAAGNESTSDPFTVTTQTLETLSLYNIRTSVGVSGVTVTWNTNIATNSVVDYGTSPGNYPYSTNNAAYVTSHSVWVSQNLTQGQTYYFRVRSTSAQGTTASSSESIFRYQWQDTVTVSVQNDSYYYWLPHWVTATSSDPQGGSTQLKMEIFYKGGGGTVLSVPMSYQSYSGQYTAEIPYYLSWDVYNGSLSIRITSSLGGSATW